MVRQVQMSRRIPTFQSIEEEAAFWDSHDSTEFEDEFEPVELTVAHPLLHGFSIYFEGDVFDRIVAAAKRRGIGFTDLAEQWVIDGLEREEGAPH
jgi:hypothetical protein